MTMSIYRWSCAGVSLNITDTNVRRSTRIVLAVLGLLTFCVAGRAADCLNVFVRTGGLLLVGGGAGAAPGAVVDIH